MRPTIFIVDDDKNIQKMLELFIRKENLGKVVGIQDSGTKAVDEILFVRPDIVLLDLLLPGKDGIQVLEDIMDGGFQGKVIMISQVDDPKMMEKAYERGIMFYVSKPLNAIEVVSVIANVTKLVVLQKSMDAIQGALQGIQAAPSSGERQLEERFQRICSDIGILGMNGVEELRRIVFTILQYQREEKNYQMKMIYEKVARELYGPGQLELNKKAMEQRMRRIMVKALDNLAQMGSEDYYDPVFADYANVLFDFGQVRLRMQNLKEHKGESGRISSKKFIEGFLLRMTAE